MKSTERLKRCGQVLKNKLVDEEAICKNVKEINQNTEIVNLQLCVAEKDSHTEVALSENAEVNKIPRLYGSGMLVINAPYLLKENTEPVIAYLEDLLKVES
jgi:23S rRNA (adenine2030-N6)-methyltransferase